MPVLEFLLSISILSSILGLASVGYWHFFYFNGDMSYHPRNDTLVFAPFCQESEIHSFLENQGHIEKELQSLEQLIPCKSREVIGINPKAEAIYQEILWRGEKDKNKRFYLMMDSNTTAIPGHVHSMVDELNKPGVALVFSPVSAVSPVSISDFVDAAMVNTTVAKAMLSASFLGFPFAIGKSIMIDSHKIRPMDVLVHARKFIAEDTAMAKFAHEQGFKTSVSAFPVLQTYFEANGQQPAFFRILRWTRILMMGSPWVFFLIPLDNVIVQTGLFWMLSEFSKWQSHAALISVAWGACAYGVDVACYKMMNPRGFLPFSTWVRKQAYCLAAWVLAPTSRTVHWRGRKIRLGSGGKIVH